MEIGFFRAVGPSIVLKAALCLMPMEAAMTVLGLCPLILESGEGVAEGDLGLLQSLS